MNNGPQIISIEKSLLPKINNYTYIPGKIYLSYYIIV